MALPLSKSGDCNKISFEDLIKLKDCGSYSRKSYDVWQRQERCKSTNEDAIKSKRVTKTKAVLSRAQTPVLHGARAACDPTPSRNGTPFTPLQKACSSLCRHWPRTPLLRTPKEHKRMFTHAEKQLLKSNVSSKRKATAHYKQLCQELRDKNAELKSSICEIERNGHAEVNGYLAQYQRCKILSSSIDSDHKSDIATASTGCHSTMSTVEKEVDRLHAEVDTLCQTVLDKEHELTTLVNYKQDMHPRRMVEIREMKKSIADLKQAFDDDLKWLDEISSAETERYKEDAELARRCLLMKMSEEAVDKVLPHIKDLAVQNVQLKKEISRFLEKEAQLEENIDLLREDIKDRKSLDLKQVAFPDVYLHRKDCMPDDIVHLRGVRQIKILPF